MGKPKYRQTTVTRCAVEMALETDLDLLTTSPATHACTAPLPSLDKIKHSSLTKAWIYDRKAQILFPHQSQRHEHPGVWDAVHYAFWSLVFLSHYFLSQSHCKETKLCYLASFQQRDKVPWKQAIVSSSCHWNWKLKLSSCRQSASWGVNTPTLPMDRKLRETAPSKALKAHAGISLFGCWESLQTPGRGTFWQLEARPEEANQQPHAQEEPPPLGLVCRKVCSQVCCADPFETDQLPPSTQANNFFISKGLFSLFCSNKGGK